MNFSWRLGAKIVAVTDLIILVVNLHLVLLAGFLISGTMHRRGIEEDQQIAELLLFILAVIICAMATGIQIRAALQLLRATQQGKHHYEALECARHWSSVTLLFLLLALIASCILLSIISFVIALLWRGTVLFIVYKFSQELSDSLSNSSTGVSDAINLPENAA